MNNIAKMQGILPPGPAWHCAQSHPHWCKRRPNKAPPSPCSVQLRSAVCKRIGCTCRAHLRDHSKRTVANLHSGAKCRIALPFVKGNPAYWLQYPIFLRDHLPLPCVSFQGYLFALFQGCVFAPFQGQVQEACELVDIGLQLYLLWKLRTDWATKLQEPGKKKSENLWKIQNDVVSALIYAGPADACTVNLCAFIFAGSSGNWPLFYSFRSSVSPNQPLSLPSLGVLLTLSLLPSS